VPAIGSVVPRQVFELALVLFLSFLLGLEREEHKARVAHYVFGGIRTFPMLGLVGYGLARISDGNVVSLAIGLAVVGALMTVSYWHKVHADAGAGATTEVSGLLTYVIGALVYTGAYWLAVAIAVVAVLLLELGAGIEKLTAKVGREEVAAFAKFLVLAIVILPVLPDRTFTRFAINPFRMWLVVVAVSGVSYASYAVQRWRKDRSGVLLTALLGGAYSSTATTVVLARQAKESAAAPRLYAGCILAASGVMYLRIIVLVALFDWALARALVPALGALGMLGIGAGTAIALAPNAGPGGATATAPTKPAAAAAQAKNPLDLRTAFAFAAAFMATLVITRLVLDWVGKGGLYVLAALMGLSDIDPFVMSLVHAGGHGESVHVVASAILIAASANGIAKGVYARAFADRATGNLALVLLVALAAAGLVAIVWI
jgi:uncharacterized membrane protein (DUF4010 family)